MIIRWKCKNCNYLNEISEEQQKKEKRDFTVMNNTLIILSGGGWFLIMLIKDLLLFSFENDSITNIDIAPSGAGKQTKNCKVCGAEKGR